MKAIDMTPIIKKHPGCFVALSDDREKVVGKGYTPEEAIEEAKKSGYKDPILTKIPYENRSYLLWSK
ncbi:MAG: DUF5678 domain-containing protein [Nitrospirota bacterium]